MKKQLVYFSIMSINDNLEFHVGRDREKVRSGKSVSKTIPVRSFSAGLAVEAWLHEALVYGLRYAPPHITRTPGGNL